MVSALETKRRLSSEIVPQYTIPAQVLKEGVVVQRVSTQHSLSYSYIERNMSHNRVAEMSLEGKRWVLVIPYEAYTPDVHLMAMRWEPDYTPDPVNVRVPEGNELMPVFADLARELLKRPLTKTIIFGYHSSPYSLLQEGYQSVPTMFHPYIFDESDFSGGDSRYMSLVKREGLSHKDRKAIRGGFYNEQFGRVLVGHTLNGHFQGDSDLLNQLFVMDQAQVDLRGVRVPTRGTLGETLRTPGFFEGFLQPFASAMNRFAEELSTTFTDLDPRYIRQKIEEAVLSRKEPEDEATQVALADITKTPQLLERPQRAQNIQLLREKGYPDSFVAYLVNVSERRLPYSGPAERLKHGFAYTFVLGQDTVTGQGFMAISVGVENGPGGVVESVLGAKLVRDHQAPFSEERMEEKKAVYRGLIKSLNGCVVQMPETCPAVEICSNFRRYGFSRNGRGCEISGNKCLNDPRAWAVQYDRYLDARLGGDRPPEHLDPKFLQLLRLLQRRSPYPLQEEE